MPITEMTVCDANGNYTTNAGTIAPHIDDKAFSFYAVITGSAVRVRIVMPLGGPESGLFRFPRVGEKVLVSKEGEPNNFLLGYVPITASQNFTHNDTEKAEVFRYKKTGANSGTDQYSEIGFYNRQTQWKPSGATVCPNIDTLNIQSTGDITQKAANYQQMRANRFELLADCPPVDHSTETRPELDQGGDDSNLYKGDAHIRAKNRVVIKAGDEIRLEVGRSAIVISDGGITITSRKTNSNINTSWDTLISLSPRAGLSMFGQHVSIGAAYDFAVSDGMGGYVKSTGGVVRLAGKDVKALAFSTAGYVVNNVGTLATLISNTAALSSAIDGAGNNSPTVNKLPSYVGMGTSLVGVVADVMFGLMSTEADYPDPVGSAAGMVKLLHTVLNIVSAVIEADIPKPLLQKAGRDGLNLTVMIVEFGMIIPLFMSIYSNTLSPFHYSCLHLSVDAQATTYATVINQLGVRLKEANSPLAGLPSNSLWKTIKNNKEMAIFGIVVAVLAGGGLGAGMYFGSYTQDAATLEKLKEL